METNKEYLADLSRIKAMCLLKLPSLYSSIIVAIRYRFTDGVTAHTNGVTMTIGKEFWSELKDKEKIFLMAHEVLHIILMHVYRFKAFAIKGKDMHLYNKAADYFINLMLEKENRGFYKFIEGGCLDERFKDMSTEEIYQYLLENGDPNEDEGSGMEGDLKPDEQTMNPGEKARIKGAIKTAIDSSKSSYGSESLLGKELLLNFQDSVVNWKSALLKFMSGTFKSSKSYVKPHRRSMYNNKLYIKTTKKQPKLGDLLVYIDVSGSCSEEDVQHMGNELYHIMTRYKPDSILFSTFNTEINQTFAIRSKADIPKHIDIDGGTDIQVCIDHIRDHKNKVCAAIIMSDMEAPDFSDPLVPTIFLVVNSPDYLSNQGKVIYYNPEG